MSFLKKSKPEATTEIVALSVLSQAAYITSKIGEEIELTEIQAMYVMSEAVKAHLTIVGYAIGHNAETISDEFYTDLIYLVASLTKENKDLPKLKKYIGEPDDKWVDDLNDYYAGNKMTKSEKEWINSPVWAGANPREENDAISTRVSLRLHYRIFENLGIKSVRESGVESLNLYILLAYHFMEDEKMWFNDVKYVL